MRDLATYHFDTRQAALDFIAECDEAGIPADTPGIIMNAAPYPVHVLCHGDKLGQQAYLDTIAGSAPASYRRGRCPFAHVAESEPGHAVALARCFIAANEPSQFWSCVRFARLSELLPSGCYIGCACFPDELRFEDHNGEFINGAFDEWREAAWSYLEALQAAAAA
jgi:hypothetical protein